MNNVNFFTRLARLAMLNVGFGSPSNSAWTENLVNYRYVAFGGYLIYHLNKFYFFLF